MYVHYTKLVKGRISVYSIKMNLTKTSYAAHCLRVYTWTLGFG
jgi:hypothetical protein